MTTHEGTCTKCGECCRAKSAHRGEQYVMPFYCPALDVGTKACTIYLGRHRILLAALGERCWTHSEALAGGGYPEHCAYRPTVSYERASRHWSELPYHIYLKFKIVNKIKQLYLRLWVLTHERRQHAKRIQDQS